MKRIILYIFGLLCVGCIASCSKDDDRAAAVHATDQGVWMDTRDSSEYHWVRYGNTEWMTENFHYDMGDATSCTIYQPINDSQSGTNTTNLAKYGRLYTEKAAEAVCPEGWRLPTDQDWQTLEQIMGMTAGDAAQRDWRGNVAHNFITEKGDTCQLNMLLGGFYNSYIGSGGSKWRLMGAFGFYWTSTKDEEKEGKYYFYRKFAYNRNEVYRESMEPAVNMLSVRYVRDAK